MSNLSFVRHTGDGKTRSFTLTVSGENIGYFRTSDIHGYVDDVEVPITINPSSPHIVTFTDAPKLGADILIRRQMPVKKTYADFARGNNFGHRQVNNTFVQQLYLTQEILDGFFPKGFYIKSDIDMGGHRLCNVGDAKLPNDAVTKYITDGLSHRINMLEQSVTGNSRFLPWQYNAEGGETELTPPYNFQSARVFINGVRQRAGAMGSYYVDNRVIRLAEPLEEGDWVDVELGTEPSDFIAQDVSNHYVTTLDGVPRTLLERFGSKRLLDIEDYGVVYNDVTKAASNYDKVVELINSGGTLYLTDKLYMKPKGLEITSNIDIISTKGGGIHWVGSGTGFKLGKGLSFSDVGSYHNVQIGHTVTYISFPKPDDILKHVIMRDFVINGSLTFNFESTQNKNPDTNPYGIDVLSVSNGVINSSSLPLVRINGVPYKNSTVKDIKAFNQKGMLLSFTLQDWSSHYTAIQNAMQSLTVDNVSVKNMRGFFADVEQGYSGILLWKGNKVTISNTVCDGVVTKNNVAVYDVYLAGKDATHTNGVMKDCYAFNNNSNTGLKIKKVIACVIENKRCDFNEDFFSYYSSNHSLTLNSSTWGNPWTIDYDGIIPADYIIKDCYIVCPKCPSDGKEKAPQLIRNLEVRDNTVIVQSGGSPYLATVKWDARAGSSSKSVVIKDNTFYCKNTVTFYLAHFNVESGTQDGGIIDISNNNVFAEGGVYELLMTNTTGSSGTTLDLLKLGNAVSVNNGEYQMIKNYCKLPSFKDTDFTGSSLRINKRSSVGIGLNPFGGSSSSGDINIVAKGGINTVSALTFHKPSKSSVDACKIVLSGKIHDDTGVRQINTVIQVKPDKSRDSISFTIKVLDSGSQTIVWDGSAGFKPVVDMGLPNSDKFTLELTRTADFASFTFKYKDGFNPSLFGLKADYFAA